MTRPCSCLVSVVAGVAAFLTMTTAVTAAPVPPVPTELPPITVGRRTVAWSPANGLSLHYDGVAVVRRSTLNIVKAGWTGSLLGQTDAPRTVTPWKDTPGGGKSAQVRLENENAVCDYRFALGSAPEEAVTVELTYRLKRDIAAEFEYAAGYLSAPLLQGAPFTAVTADGERGGSVAVAPPPAGRTQEQNRLAPPFTRLTFRSRVATVSVAYSGDAPHPILFDARADAQGWAEEFPVFWMGIGSPAAPLRRADGERQATFQLTFTPNDTASPGGPSPTLSSGEPGTAGLIERADARAPVLAPTPLVIPRPKRMATLDRPFRITPETRIVIADGATLADKRGAELLRKALQKRFGRDVPLVRARAAVRGVNVIAVGEPTRNAVLDRLLAAENIIPPAEPEGYALAVTPRAVLVAGRDRQGTLWGIQTLIQLVAADRTSVLVRPVRISDWPTLSVRAVHLFHGQNALPFHKKLIDRILSPFKLNALFLQVEQLRWDADPAIAPPWAGRKEQVAQEIEYARRRGLTVYPLVQSHGHMEWLFRGKNNLDFAEDPETPYALNVTNPQAVAYLERINAEADRLFGAPGFHVGLDEVTMRGRFPHRSAPKSFADLFLRNVKHWHGFFAKRGRRLWMWADMALHRSDAPPSFGTAPTPDDAARIRRELPKDIVLVDWQYGTHERFPSLRLLKDAGFDVVAATWYNPVNIQNFARVAAQVEAKGAMQTTWAGYESKEAILDTEQRKQFVAFVLAAEYFWNGGAGPAPENLPYAADAVFARQWQEPDPADTQVRSGFMTDLSPLATRPVADWLGYGEAHGLSRLPTGEQRLLDGTLYRIAPEGGLLLAGKLNPPGSYPMSQVIPLFFRRADGAIIARQAREMRLLVAASHRAAPGTRLGAVRALREDGTTGSFDLVYGSNIAAADDLASAPGAAIVWKGRTPSDQPVVLRSLVWKNPDPDLPLRTLTVTSTNTESAPAVFAVTALE